MHLMLVVDDRLGDVNIRSGIFQDDSLSPLLFVISFIPLQTLPNNTDLGYQTFKTSSEHSHLLDIDDLKLYGKSLSDIESLLNTI